MNIPDRLFTNGSAFTGAGHQRFAGSVAVVGDRIVAVGGPEVDALAGPATQVVDLHGALLVPGFQDAHIHPIQAGLELLSCDLSATVTRANTLRVVQDYASTHPALDWIVGGGWTASDFPHGSPLAGDLDAIVSDRPVFLMNRDHHSAWVNSRALEAARINASTPDPVDGRIDRLPDHAPSGCLHEGAMDLVSALIPPISTDDLLAGLLTAQRHLHALGITSWQDAIIGDYTSVRDGTDAYLRAEHEGLLTAKVVGALWWDRSQGAEQVPELLRRRAERGGTRFRPTTVKIMLDGVVESRTAAMLSPYLDSHGHDTTHSGAPFIAPEALREYVTQLDAAGFQVHIHAIGDAAVRDALDAFEAALKSNGPGDNRHHIAHIEVIDPVDVPRFHQLGVSANMQPLWAAYEPQMRDLAIPALGPRRSDLQYPFGSLVASGARLAGGSDWPVTSADPIQGMHVAVNRHLPGSDEPVFTPAQRLDLATALTAYTAGSAYVNHLDQSGTIAVGQLADLVVLDRDPFQGPREEIARTRVRATYVEGRCVHESSDDERQQP